MLAAQQKTTIEQPCRALELFPFRWNRNGALDSCFDAFSSREPASTSLENALAAEQSSRATAECWSGIGWQRSAATCPPSTFRSRWWARRRRAFAHLRHRAKQLLAQILFEDRHLELERAIIILVVDEQHADEFFADIDLGRVVLLRPRHHADLGIAEYAFEIRVKLPDFLNVHGSLQSGR